MKLDPSGALLHSRRVMSLRLPIGISDFRKLREARAEYVDKSRLIMEILDRAAEVFLLPRPRRFGKTLNLSMLRYFFEKQPEDLSYLFEGLSVWEAGETYRAHFQRYPVIFMSFRDVKASSFEQCWTDIQKKIQALFREHKVLLSSGVLEESEARDYQAILDDTAETTLYRRALGDLSHYLHRATGERAMILIDEYDEPIHAGHVNGYGKEIIDFFRNFLTMGLKDNPHLERGVVTGILRIARESIFSGLNNLAVFTLLEDAFGTCFGFTESEVEVLLDKGGMREQREIVRTWYNGYIFGDTVIYNPWSVLNFLARGGRAQPYWLNTSSNDLIKSLLEGRSTQLQEIFERLLEGGGIDKIVDENVVLDELETNDDALWSLLVFSGYLKAERRPPKASWLPPSHVLTIPNSEVRLLYVGTFARWMRARIQGHGGHIDRLIQALLKGDAAALEKQLGAFVKNILSYHDIDPDEPERIYQAFVLGLCAAVEPEHRLRSNRESGKGRPDVMLLPLESGQPGVILELKVARKNKSLEDALEEGLTQVAAKDYEAELRAAGAEPIHVFVCACDGKEVRVAGGADRD